MNITEDNIDIGQSTPDISGDKKEIFKSKGFKAAILIVIILLIAYLGGAIYYQNRYLPGTKIGETKISGKTAEQTKQLLTDETKEYKLTLTGRKGYQEEISSNDVDLNLIFTGKLEKLLKEQNSLLWFLGASKEEKELKAGVSYDEKKLNKKLASLSCFDKKNIIKPENAKIVVGEKGNYIIKKEIYGTTVKKSSLKKAIQDAFVNVENNLDLSKAKCYQDPKITKKNSGKMLEDRIKEAKKLADVTVTYDFKYTTETVDKKLIQDWITFGKDDSKVNLSYEKVLKYVENLAKKYDTYSKTRTVKDGSGRKHKVYYGSYGWKISQTREAKALMKVIKKGKSVTREPLYLYKAVCRKKGNIDWDDTYVCVDITNQHMQFIKKGKVVLSSYIVTGDPTKGHSTPTGAYEVMYKVRNQTLVGQGYASKVSYFIPFTTNVGFHDATWRNSFGGSSYRGNGSHGCVNMPPSNAAALYGILEKGTPVFVYK